MKKNIISILILLISIGSIAQNFTSTSSVLNNTYHSGGVVGVTDMNNDGYDDIIIMDESNTLYLEYQNVDGTFSASYIGQMGSDGQWGMAIGDVDNDGHNDVISGGYYDGLHVAHIISPSVFDITTNNNYPVFMQGLSFGDINNDGWIDAYGCNDDGEGAIWGNNGTGNLEIQNSWIDMTTTPASDNSGNYGSVFCDIDDDGDLDLYIAKCRQGVTDPNDPRRINALFINDGNNNFTEEAEERGLAPHKQSWTSDFMDIDNDGDFDCFLTNHDYSLMIFENDGTGHFTDITATSGMQNTTGFFLQGKFEDFDNDGYIDLLYAGGDAGMFHNNGDNTFTPINVTFNNEDVLHSFGIGDLNHDGFQDFYASYGNGYITFDDIHEDKLWLNSGNANNWLTVQLSASVSNGSAIGAKVKIYGDWGVQVREVRGGESYGITNSFALHFGLGTAASIDYMTVTWPSGAVTFLDNPAINQFLLVEENICPDLTVSITGSTGEFLCSGETSVLTATSTNSNILWSTGSTESSITVTQPGNYSAIVYDAEGCAGLSEVIPINYYESITPEISASGPLSFCSGGSVELAVDNVQNGNTYTWSNNDSGTTSIVTTSGSYSVTTIDGCDNSIVSPTIEVEVLQAPAPMVEDQQLILGQTVTFTSSTEDTYWYETETSETPIDTGMFFTTPILNENTTYWVQTTTGNNTTEYEGGKITNDADGIYQDNSNYWMYFDAYTDLTIHSVKVYAGSAGERTIIIETLLEQVYNESIFIPEGESVIILDAFIPQGTDYTIRTIGDPDLWRDSSEEDLDYPYEIGDVLAITGTNIQTSSWNNYYYFFYDWHISVGEEPCYSELVEITASTDISISNEGVSNNRFSVYPNPFNESIAISNNGNFTDNAIISIYNALGELVLSKNIDLESQAKVILDLSKLNIGIYTVNVMIDKEVYSYKLLKQ